MTNIAKKVILNKIFYKYLYYQTVQKILNVEYFKSKMYLYNYLFMCIINTRKINLS
jgi:hypothetical protein